METRSKKQTSIDIAAAIKEINSTSTSPGYKLISSVCEKYNLSQTFIRKIAGWTKTFRHKNQVLIYDRYTYQYMKGYDMYAVTFYENNIRVDKVIINPEKFDHLQKVNS